VNPPSEARLDKVKRTSRSARRVCFWLMAFVALAATVMALSTVGLPESMTCAPGDGGGLRRPCSDLPALVVAFAYVDLLSAAAAGLAALYFFSRLFANYARGEIFTRDSVRELRFVSYSAVAYVVLQFVLFVAALALAIDDVESAAGLHVGFGISPMLWAGFMVLLVWVMDVGAEIREENELTV
jgi:hypothetical protein